MGDHRLQAAGGRCHLRPARLFRLDTSRCLYVEKLPGRVAIRPVRHSWYERFASRIAKATLWYFGQLAHLQSVKYKAVELDVLRHTYRSFPTSRGVPCWGSKRRRF